MPTFTAFDVIFSEEQDSIVNPPGVNGVGELGVVGTAAAIANAVFHPTGVRVRDLPIRLDKVFGKTATSRTTSNPVYKVNRLTVIF